MERFGKIDVAVACAGIVENYSALEYVNPEPEPTIRSEALPSSYPADRVKRLFDINVHGVFYTAREAARNMIPNGSGSIILISSMSANVGPDDDPFEEKAD